MAVVVSSSQNDVAIVKAKGGDIKPHRKRMLKEDLETKFKDADDPFRIVFVCAMWITGFDVPSCSTMYIDKPMRNHTLMQTIARANRVFKDKVNGLIVDYVGIFRHLEKALSIYGTSGGGIDSPVKHKDELKSELIEAIDNLMNHVSGLGVDIDKIRKAEDMNSRLRMFMDARDTLVQSEDVKKEYLKQANQVKRLYKAYLPDKIDKALPAVKDINTSDEDMDRYADKAEKAFEDLMDLGFNVEDRNAGHVFAAAKDMLKNAIEAKGAKADRKLKAIELQIKKMRLDQNVHKEPKVIESSDFIVSDRNSMLSALSQNNDK